MNKKFTVRLSDEERDVCQEIVKKFKGVIRRVETSHSSAGWNQRDVMPE